MRRIVKIICEIEVPFEEYSTKAENTKAERYIKKQIRDILFSECLFIDLPEGDCSKETKIKIRRPDQPQAKPKLPANVMVEEHLKASKRVMKKVLSSKKNARKFLIDAGILGE